MKDNNGFRIGDYGLIATDFLKWPSIFLDYSKLKCFDLEFQQSYNDLIQASKEDLFFQHHQPFILMCDYGQDQQIPSRTDNEFSKWLYQHIANVAIVSDLEKIHLALAADIR